MPHNARGGIQTEGAPSGQQHGMDHVDKIDRTQQVGFPRSGSAASYVNADGRPLITDNDGGAGSRLQILRVPNPHAPDFGKRDLPHRSPLSMSHQQNEAAPRGFPPTIIPPGKPLIT